MAGGKRGGRGGRGAKPGSYRKGAQLGSGGKGRGRLQGKGPTPPAELRPGHPAARRAEARRSATRRERPARPAAASPPGKERPEVVAGRNPVVEALRAGVPSSTLYVAERIDYDSRVREAVRTAADIGVPLLEASRGELDRVTGGAHHQGLALQVPPYDYAHPDDLLTRAQDTGEVPLIVALDGVTDPRNLGAVARSVAAFGGHGVVVPERRAAGVTSGAWKASAGALARVPVARAPNLTRTLERYKSAGVFAVGLAASGESTVADLEVAVAPLVLVVGAEGRGLSRLVAETCDLTARIPMGGAVESLNAGVATGIALYEIARRRTS